MGVKIFLPCTRINIGTLQLHIFFYEGETKTKNKIVLSKNLDFDHNFNTFNTINTIIILMEFSMLMSFEILNSIWNKFLPNL